MLSEGLSGLFPLLDKNVKKQCFIHNSTLVGFLQCEHGLFSQNVWVCICLYIYIYIIGIVKVLVRL